MAEPRRPEEPSRDEVAAVAALAENYQALRAEIAKVIIGQDDVVEQLLTGLFARGHVLLVGRAGAGQDAAGQHAGPTILSLSFQPDPVHARPDAVGHHRHRHPPGRPRDRPPRVRVRRRAGLRQHHPGRRDQPHPAQDPGRAAGGDAGAAGHRRRPDLPAARPVLRAGHPEPDRAGGDLPAARGPARPVHVQHPGRLPDAPPRSWRSSAGRPATTPPEPTVTLSAEQIVALQQLVRRVPVADHVFDYARDLVRASRPERARGDRRSCSKCVVLGRRAPRRPVPDPRRPRPAPCSHGRLHAGDRRHPPRRPARCSATGSSPPSTPRPRGSTPTRSSTTSSTPSPPRPSAPRPGWWGREAGWDCRTRRRPAVSHEINPYQPAEAEIGELADAPVSKPWYAISRMEVLIILAIVAILFALLFPAMSHSRHRRERHPRKDGDSRPAAGGHDGR